MTVVVIGGGHNGLAASYYLARAGLKPIVLESRPACGGGAITTEIQPGFLCPTLSHHTPLGSDVFSVRIPPTAMPITLDELRVSGPLNGR